MCLCETQMNLSKSSINISVVRGRGCLFILNYESRRLNQGIILVLHTMNNACSTIIHILHVVEPEWAVMLINTCNVHHNNSECFIARRNGDPKDIHGCQSNYNSQLLNLQLYYPLSLHLIWVISQNLWVLWFASVTLVRELVVSHVQPHLIKKKKNKQQNFLFFRAQGD